MSIHAIDLARSPNRGEADPARFGEYAVNIHTSSSCRSPNRLKGQLHVPPPPPLAHANVLVYELVFISVRRVLITTLELVHTALLRTRTVRDLRARACACVSVRVLRTPLPAVPVPVGPLCECARASRADPCRHLCCRGATRRRHCHPRPMLGGAGAWRT